MLTTILDETMAKAKNYERTVTRASKFSDEFKMDVKDNSLQEEIMNEKLKQYIANPQTSTDIVKDVLYDEKTLIVENPDEIPVEITFEKKDSGLPFFRSIYLKLLEV